ncbi:hypothetical protein DSO57_1016672 [Entomophthora muscae]|uniref:Uncharacterized protein n=1 Tax=Entomophthora muscae TaxID=34485 RepID=A0ACC2UE44_9FUNG|nr:hypothetical protein DSO57_1016672 [Entomophthora muscae]
MGDGDCHFVNRGLAALYLKNISDQCLQVPNFRRGIYVKAYYFDLSQMRCVPLKMCSRCLPFPSLKACQEKCEKHPKNPNLL